MSRLKLLNPQLQKPEIQHPNITHRTLATVLQIGRSYTQISTLKSSNPAPTNDQSNRTSVRYQLRSSQGPIHFLRSIALVHKHTSLRMSNSFLIVEARYEIYMQNESDHANSHADNESPIKGIGIAYYTPSVT